MILLYYILSNSNIENDCLRFNEWGQSVWQKQKSELNSDPTRPGKKFRYMALVVQDEYEENKDQTLAKLSKMMQGQIYQDSKVASLVIFLSD